MSLFPNYYSVLVVSLLGTPMLLYILRLVALRVGLVDVPNVRKIHAKPVPLVGGLVLFIMAVVLLSMTNNVNAFSFYLLTATGLVVIVGLLDDLYQLSALWRFIVQIIASLVVIYFSNVQLYTFGLLLYPDWEMNLGIFAIPITVFGVVGVINSINMADGIDGLAGMTFFIPVLALALLAGSNDFSLWLLLLLICVMIFVVFNKSVRNKVFLGDNGSLLLGFILAWLLVYFSQGSQATIKPITALYLVGLPVYDTIFVMLKRILSHQSPFKPDNTHLHHLFLAKGLSQTRTLFVVVALQTAMVVLGLVFLHINLAEYYQFYLFILMSAIYYFIMHKIWQKSYVSK
ncbi:Undecaprenyl-phosphate alpha-N-acetylglucosaminyl 1-phosphate transferase [hydrothermal vent metagenome]|uniref:Undecaprenyl-phosphate alpha-N-acetylglucosaminyl 1-phosphate transferase n=1 Tax=hydrothermal vent metagenome TaxID=652676 RepID=A0A3B0VSA0_9ZZZZ